MTWVGSGEKEGESFHVCFSAAQCWRGRTVAEQGSAWSASIPIKEQCVFICLSAFYRPHEISYFAALPPSPRAGAVAGGPARAGPHAHAVQLTSQRKNRSADAFHKQNRTRAHAVVYVTAEIFKKKGKRKPTCHFPSSVYSLPSLGVFTFRIVLNRILQIVFAGPHGITENQATYLHCGGEARAKKRARSPATCRKASRGKTGADTGPKGCGSPAVFPSPCLDLQRLQS